MIESHSVDVQMFWNKVSAVCLDVDLVWWFFLAVRINDHFEVDVVASFVAAQL